MAVHAEVVLEWPTGLEMLRFGEPPNEPLGLGDGVKVDVDGYPDRTSGSRRAWLPTAGWCRC